MQEKNILGATMSYFVYLWPKLYMIEDFNPYQKY